MAAQHSAIKASKFVVVKPQALVSQSDLIVHGRITNEKALLSADDSYVVTDYEIVPLRILKHAMSAMTSTAGKLVSMSSIVVRVEGGHLIEDGLDMKTTVLDYPEADMFKVGEEVIVFLQYLPDDRVFRFTGGSFDAFSVQNGQVSAMTKEAAQRRGDAPMTIRTFVGDVQQRLAIHP
jgi:hypothetical protein